MNSLKLQMLPFGGEGVSVNVTMYADSLFWGLRPCSQKYKNIHRVIGGIVIFINEVSV